MMEWKIYPVEQTSPLLYKLCEHLENTYEDDILKEVPDVKKWWRDHQVKEKNVDLEKRFCEIDDIYDYDVCFNVKQGNIFVEVSLFLNDSNPKTLCSVNCGLLETRCFNTIKKEMLAQALNLISNHPKDQTSKDFADYLLDNFDEIHHPS